MSIEPATRTNGVRAEPVESVALRPDDDLRALARDRIERVRSFKLHAAIFAVALPVLTVVWTLTEYLEDNTWPSRLAADDGDPGNWDPWIIWVFLVWGTILAVHALRTYFHRPATEAEIEREIERLRARR